MLVKRTVGLVAVLFIISCACGESANAQVKKMGSVTGEIKSLKPTPNGKNVFCEVLAPGEEQARAYRVVYDPAVKAPNAAVLAAVKAAKVGDTCKLDWIDTGEGLAITKFEILKKASK